MSEIVLPNPHPAQQTVLDERQRFNVVACGRRWGKTKLGATLALQTAIAGKPAGWFAPSYKTLGDVLTELRWRLRDVPKSWAKYNAQDKRLELGSGGLIEFWSTEPQQTGEEESDVARGRKYARIVYDEAAHARRLRADWTKAIRPTLADYKGDAWFFSTPRGQEYFYQLWRRGQAHEQGWASWQMPTKMNPHIDASEIEDAKRDLPSDAFEQEWLAQFLANAANPFGIDHIRACTTETLASGPVAYWGCDLARSHDWTVAIGLNASGNVCAFQRWQSDWMMTGERLAAMFKNTPSYVDATGVGAPIVEALQKRCGNIEPYTFTSASKQKLMGCLAYAIQRREVAFPQGEIVNELEAFRYEYKPGGVRYSAPKGLHDDCVCALALAVMCKAQTPQAITVSTLGGELPPTPWDSGYNPLDDDDMWRPL